MSKFPVRKMRILALMLEDAFQDESYDTLDQRSDSEIADLFYEHIGKRKSAEALLAEFESKAGQNFNIVEKREVNIKFKIKYQVAGTQPEENLVEGSVREKVFSIVEKLGVANKLEVNAEYGSKCGNIVDTLVKKGYLEALPLSEEDAAEAQAEAAPAKAPSKGRKTKRPAKEAAADAEAADAEAVAAE